MGENGTIGWPENRLFVHAAIFIRTGPGNCDRMVASKHGLVRDFGAQPRLLNPTLNGEVSAFDFRGDCQEFCAVGHDDEKERIITWLSRKNFWTSSWLDVIHPRFSARTVCWTI
ncbi:hypothetical protein [Sinorhizobium meliloti]|nr:hypothetical protein [Sinorhizobium meliloti]